MVEDGVDLDLALKIAKGYAEARTTLNDEKTHLWLNTMLTALDGIRTSTAIAVLAYPCEHQVDHYNALALEAGWKEDDDAAA